MAGEDHPRPREVGGLLVTDLDTVSRCLFMSRADKVPVRRLLWGSSTPVTRLVQPPVIVRAIRVTGRGFAGRM